MKRIWLISSAVILGSAAALLADPPPPLEKIPLPAGSLIKRAPTFAKWQIAFTYAKEKSASGGTDAPAADGDRLPTLVTVTLTRPIWHAEMIVGANQKSECWFDGNIPFLQTPGRSAPAVAPQEGFDDPNVKRPYIMPSFLNCIDNDFPDVGWVSEKTYLGVQRGGSADYLVFEQAPGEAKVWVDAATRYPVVWQKGRETRRFQFLPPPTENLVLPPEAAQVSKMIKQLQKISTNQPTRGS